MIVNNGTGYGFKHAKELAVCRCEVDEGRLLTVEMDGPLMALTTSGDNTNLLFSLFVRHTSVYYFHIRSVYAWVLFWTTGLVKILYHWSSPICTRSCIPCGHVYGRSCLEKWLHRSGDSGAKVPWIKPHVHISYMWVQFLGLSIDAYLFSQCPQCGEQFEHKLITNLYAPGNLWDGCCRLQVLSLSSGVLVYIFFLLYGVLVCMCQIMNNSFPLFMEQWSK